MYINICGYDGERINYVYYYVAALVRWRNVCSFLARRVRGNEINYLPTKNFTPLTVARHVIKSSNYSWIQVAAARVSRRSQVAWNSRDWNINMAVVVKQNVVRCPLRAAVWTHCGTWNSTVVDGERVRRIARRVMFSGEWPPADDETRKPRTREWLVRNIRGGEMTNRRDDARYFNIIRGGPVFRTRRKYTARTRFGVIVSDEMFTLPPITSLFTRRIWKFPEKMFRPSFRFKTITAQPRFLYVLAVDKLQLWKTKTNLVTSKI